MMKPIQKEDMKTLTSNGCYPTYQKRTKTIAREAIDPIFLQPVSLHLTEQSSLKHVLQETARHAGADLRLDPAIKASLIYQATKKPLLHVIKDICDMAQLKYAIEGRQIIIEKDIPYNETYNIQFLNLERKTESRIGSATDIFSENSNKDNASGNGSNSETTSKTSTSFWEEIDSNLKMIMSAASPKGHYSMHKQAGLLSVVATQKVHRQIKSLLNAIYKVANAQVLIEAKIVEVALKDSFYNGINWSKIGSKSDWTINMPFGEASKTLDGVEGSQAPNLFSFGLQGTQFGSIINSLEEFGTLRTLSSPRLTVMNNQVAVLKVAQNQVYFRIKYDKSTGTGNNPTENVSVSSDVHTFPIGLVMTVQPSIDPLSGMVTLFVRPTLTNSNQTVKDPSAEIAYNNSLQSGTTSSSVSFTPATVPVIDVREMESVMRLQDGEIAVMGGLMTGQSANHKQGLPGLYDKPILQDIFGAQLDANRMSELVILIRVNIKDVDQVPYPDAADQRLLTYVSDPRSFC